MHHYPIWIDTNDPYVVHVPDLPGCFTQADTIEQAMDMAREAILLYLDDHDGPWPTPKPISQHTRKAEYKKGMWAVIRFTESDLSGKAVRLNISVPERDLALIDQYAHNRGQTRSAVLVKGALELVKKGE